MLCGGRETRRGIAQRLPGVGERLVAHIFVEKGEEHGIRVLGVLLTAAPNGSLKHPNHVP
jgi:hypothetical protein